MHLTLPIPRVRQLLRAAHKTEILVVGDAMLDQFVWGHVSRISPEAPVPVLEFERESFMPGGAANVARNLAALNVRTELFGVIGRDAPGAQLKRLLAAHGIGHTGLIELDDRPTSLKTRIIAQRQQIVRVDRECKHELDGKLTEKLLTLIRRRLDSAAAVIVGDYGKGVVTQLLLDELKRLCRARGVWLSVDPKPVHKLDLTGVSLVTPNRKEAFELAAISDNTHSQNPLADASLMRVSKKLFDELHPALLLITLGELGMLLCQRHHDPIHIPTAAKEVFDVSGAGDTVIACFTLAIAAGASPVEAAIFSNHAAGIVVGKVGTATASPAELLESFGHK
ncbi:MAG: D-glycero-beta-D-manno-heptose-7-phosphate kinase [Verrucomicrobiae bacterium]|nr:D-glycero-beta-D-manno-heptose-7-phosphate kinase [Verrucomicrobiae bacterium]